MKITKIAALALILTTAAILLSGCVHKSSPTADSEPGIDTSKTAVLFSSLAEMWTDAGGDIYATVGETVERGFASEGTLLVDSGAGKTVNTELLISYEPTLVICSADVPAQVECAKILNENGIRAITFHVESFGDYVEAFKTMTDITGNSAALESLVTLQHDRIEAVIADNAGDGESILFVRAGSSASSTKAKLPQDHFACAMLEELGCKNIASDAEILLDGLSEEALLTADPDVIFFSLMGNEDAARANVDSLLKSDAWSNLTAVKKGRVYILPRELFHFKPCSRWAEAYEYLSDALAEVAK